MTALLIRRDLMGMNLTTAWTFGVYYMDTIADCAQDGGTVILNEEGTVSFDPLDS